MTLPETKDISDGNGKAVTLESHNHSNTMYDNLSINSVDKGSVTQQTKSHHEAVDAEMAEPTSARDKHGLGVGTAAFFILGELAGSGVVALPYAIKGTGYIGIVLMVAFCIMAAYTGILLGKCWIMMEERYEDCRQVQRKPYQLMGSRCVGEWMGVVITVLIQVYLLGACVVFSVLISGMLADLFRDLWPTSICYWDMIVIAILIPLTWFGTPKDFWPLAVVAAVTIIIASLLTTIQAIIDSDDSKLDHVYYPNPEFKSFSLAFGTILFAFGGAVAFPTFQNDMKKRDKFPLAASIGFAGTLCIYIPVASAGYFVYGNLVESNITMSLDSAPIRMTVQVCMIVHLFCASVLLSNPCFQNLEDMLKINPGFSVWKISFRTLVILFILFVGETVPNFGVILDLLGGSINPILCFILPIVFYMRLVATQSSSEFQHLNLPKRIIPLFEWVLMWEFIGVSTLGGIAATVSAITELIAPDAMSLPCYVSLVPPPGPSS